MNFIAIYKDKSKIHFRHHKPTKHNKVIVGEDKFKYDYLNITHSERRDKTHLNEKFIVNPKFDDIDPKTKKIRDSHYERRLHNDLKSNFDSKRNKSWYLSSKDLSNIYNLVSKKSKKK